MNDTYETGHSTLFDSLVILSDGNGLVPDAEEFAALAYKHKNRLSLMKQQLKIYKMAKSN